MRRKAVILSFIVFLGFPSFLLCKQIKFSKPMDRIVYLANDAKYYYIYTQNKEGAWIYQFAGDGPDWKAVEIGSIDPQYFGYSACATGNLLVVCGVSICYSINTQNMEITDRYWQFWRWLSYVIDKQVVTPPSFLRSFETGQNICSLYDDEDPILIIANGKFQKVLPRYAKILSPKPVGDPIAANSQEMLLLYYDEKYEKVKVYNASSGHIKDLITLTAPERVRWYNKPQLLNKKGSFAILTSIRAIEFEDYKIANYYPIPEKAEIFYWERTGGERYPEFIIYRDDNNILRDDYKIAKTKKILSLTGVDSLVWSDKSTYFRNDNFRQIIIISTRTGQLIDAHAYIKSTDEYLDVGLCGNNLLIGKYANDVHIFKIKEMLDSKAKP